MYKKFLSLFVCCIVLFFSFPMVAHADIGPKPSVNLDFVGIENQLYYITLLSEQESTGPYSFSTDPIDEDSYLIKDDQADGLEAWQAFRNYQDTDGFYFLNFFRRCNEQDTFHWTYYPPHTFKVLIYFPAKQQLISSEILDTYAFDSYYEVTLSEDMTSLSVQKNYDTSTETTSLLIRILLTLVVEILLALLFGFRKKKLLLFVIVVNVITQVILNVLLNIINYMNGEMAYVLTYIGLEILVIVIEAVLYSIYFKKAKTDKPIKSWIAPVYSITANCASFVVGLLISFQLPGIF